MASPTADRDLPITPGRLTWLLPLPLFILHHCPRLPPASIMSDTDMAEAGTVITEDVTTSAESNRVILRKLRENNPKLDKLWVYDGSVGGSKEYCPAGAHDMALLGYFIGQNTSLKELCFWMNPVEDISECTELFFRGVNCNRSIQKLDFSHVGLLRGETFQLLRPFFENNDNLSKLDVSGCDFGYGAARWLSLALRSCKSSLKSVDFSYNEMKGHEQQWVDIIEALSMHPQLKELEMGSTRIGRNECRALANVLRISDLHTLDLRKSGIDDRGVGALLAGNLANSKLRLLDLSYNHITARGCRKLAAMLENPSSNLEDVYLHYNHLGDKGALLFANALARNRKPKVLDIWNNAITTDGWGVFLKVLCDDSSVNKTFLSNHTLIDLGVYDGMHDGVSSSLALNWSSDDKNQVAIKKILKHHRHLNMEPFFEWDLKILPLMISWLERARSIEGTDEYVIDKHKLGGIYQFIRAMPDIFEPAPTAGGRRRKRSSVEYALVGTKGRRAVELYRLYSYPGEM